MTVSYPDGLVKLFFCWKGSIWKAVWKELFVWLIIYYAIQLTLKYFFSESENIGMIYEVAKVFNQFTIELPIDFTLSFYVGQVITRWWSQALALPWPDEIMNLMISAIDGADKHSQLMRFSIGRYLVLTQCLALRDLSVAVRKRFPTIKHFATSNLMTNEELDIFLSCSKNLKWQLPLSWVQSLIIEAVDKKGQPLSPAIQTSMIQELNKYRTNLRTLYSHNWICIPLVYTQATGLGLYGYFVLCLIGDQHVAKASGIPVPIMTTLEFLFYVGWFKVAQKLMQPFGEADDDIEVNYLLDRHLKIVQSMSNYITQPKPLLIEDKFCNDKNPLVLSRTKLSGMIKDKPPKLHSLFRKSHERSLMFKEVESDYVKNEVFYF